MNTQSNLRDHQSLRAPKGVVALKLIGAATLLFASGVASIGVENTSPPVEVQGVVETLNDVLATPYNEHHETVFLEDSHYLMKFEIPAGKRLIVETISVWAEVPPGDSVSVGLYGGLDFSVRMYLPLQSQGVFFQPAVIARGNKEIFVGAHPVRFRVDSAESGLTLEFRRNVRSRGKCRFQASMHGYLVDL